MLPLSFQGREAPIGQEPARAEEGRHPRCRRTTCGRREGNPASTPCHPRADQDGGRRLPAGRCTGLTIAATSRSLSWPPPVLARAGHSLPPRSTRCRASPTAHWPGTSGNSGGKAWRENPAGSGSPEPDAWRGRGLGVAGCRRVGTVHASGSSGRPPDHAPRRREWPRGRSARQCVPRGRRPWRPSGPPSGG